jgi:hypothetical protein
VISVSQFHHGKKKPDDKYLEGYQTNKEKGAAKYSHSHHNDLYF